MPQLRPRSSALSSDSESETRVTRSKGPAQERADTPIATRVRRKLNSSSDVESSPPKRTRSSKAATLSSSDTETPTSSRRQRRSTKSSEPLSPVHEVDEVNEPQEHNKTDDHLVQAVLESFKNRLKSLPVPVAKETETPAKSKRNFGALHSGLESVPLYIKYSVEEGAVLDLDAVGEDDELSDAKPDQLMKRSIIKPDLEKHLVAPSLRPPKKTTKESDTAGPKWFDMAAPEMTPEIKRDLQLIKMRNVIDPKRFYKKDGSKELPKYFQFGTVVESSADFYASRVPKRQRKEHLVDELLADDKSKQYFKRRFAAIQDKAKFKGPQKGVYRKKRRQGS